jgi:hypothetical protein
MKRIKSFKLFESKDGMDVIDYAEELMQDLWDISLSQEFFDRGFGLKIQGYINHIYGGDMARGGETEWFLDTEFNSEVTPDHYTFDLNNFDEIEEYYNMGSKPVFRIGIISIDDEEEAFLNKEATGRLYDIIISSWGDKEVIIEKLSEYDAF